MEEDKTYDINGHRLKWCDKCKKYVLFAKVLTKIETNQGYVEGYFPYCGECYSRIIRSEKKC